MAWGQFTDHDITLTSEIDEVEEEDLNCCNGDLDLLTNFHGKAIKLKYFPNFRPKCDAPYVFSNHGELNINNLAKKKCNSICTLHQIPENDHFYAQHNQRCMNFVRSNGGVRPGCRLGPRETENRVSCCNCLPIYCSCEVKQIFYCPDHINLGCQCGLLQQS